jgi:hypothetical protein
MIDRLIFEAATAFQHKLIVFSCSQRTTLLIRTVLKNLYLLYPLLITTLQN